MEPEESEPERLFGWFVVEVGRCQAWPYVGLADPDSGREVQLYIDTTFSVTPRWTGVNQHDDAALAALDELSNLTVRSVDTDGAGLELDLGHIQLRVHREANDLTSHAQWWIGTRSA